MTLLIKTSALNLMVFISRHLSYYFKKYQVTRFYNDVVGVRN